MVENTKSKLIKKEIGPQKYFTFIYPSIVIFNSPVNFLVQFSGCYRTLATKALKHKISPNKRLTIFI